MESKDSVLYGRVKRINMVTANSTKFVILTNDNRLLTVKTQAQRSFRIQNNMFVYLIGSFDESGKVFNALSAGAAPQMLADDNRQTTVTGTVVEVCKPGDDEYTRRLLVNASGARYAVSGYEVFDGVQVGDHVTMHGEERGVSGGEHLFWADSIDSPGRKRKLAEDNTPKTGQQVDVEGQVVRVVTKGWNGPVDHIFIRPDGNPTERIQVTGFFPFSVTSGDRISVKGTYMDPNKYGRPINLSSYEITNRNLSDEQLKQLKDIDNTVTILEATAIFEKFGEKTMETLKEKPGLVRRVTALTQERADHIASAFEDQKKFENLKERLSSFGMEDNTVRWISKNVESQVPAFMKNPYSMVGVVHGINFSDADEMALRSGIRPDSGIRIKALVTDILDSNARRGDNCMNEEALLKMASDRISVPVERIRETVDSMVSPPDRTLRRSGGMLYLPDLYKAERRVAERLSDLTANNITKRNLSSKPVNVTGAMYTVKTEVGYPVPYLSEYLDAANTALTHRVSAISGKMDRERFQAAVFVTSVFRSEGAKVAYVAATEKTRIRMEKKNEATMETLDRLLEKKADGSYGRKATNPLDYDVVVMDGCEDIDVQAMEAFLSAVPKKTKVVFVGDPDKIPSDGLGSAFADILESGIIPVCKTPTAARAKTSEEKTQDARTTLLKERLRGEIHETQRIRIKGERAVKPTTKRMPRKAEEKRSSETAGKDIVREDTEMAAERKPEQETGRMRVTPSEKKPEDDKAKTTAEQDRKNRRDALAALANKPLAKSHPFSGRNIVRYPVEKIDEQDRLFIVKENGNRATLIEIDDKKYLASLHPKHPGVVIMEPTEDVLARTSTFAKSLPYDSVLALANGIVVSTEGRNLCYDVFTGKIKDYVKQSVGKAPEKNEPVNSVQKSTVMTSTDKVKMEFAENKDVQVMSMEDFLKTVITTGGDANGIAKQMMLVGRMEGCITVNGKAYIAERHPSCQDVVLVMGSDSEKLKAAVAGYPLKEAGNMRYGQSFFEFGSYIHKAYSIFHDKVVKVSDYRTVQGDKLAKQEKDALNTKARAFVEKAIKEGTSRHLK